MLYTIFYQIHGYLSNFLSNFDIKETKKDRTVPFCVPLILEAVVPASFLSNFRGIRSCLVPQKKERVPERVPFETRSSMLCFPPRMIIRHTRVRGNCYDKINFTRF